MLNPIRSPDNRASTVALPDPGDAALQGREVLIYDGQCNFCTAGVTSLYRLDWTRRLTFISLHDPRVSQLWPQLSFDQLMEQVWLVTRDGKTYGGADAMRYLSSRMPSLWPIAPLMNLPFTMPLWRKVYRWVARNRYRIAGRNCENGTCSLHGK